MTFFVLHDSGQAILATDRRVLKVRERMVVQDAVLLLERAREWEQGQKERCAAAEAEARERGFREGHEKGLDAFSQAISELARQAASYRQTEEREVASLALSALRRMIDDIGDAEMMAGLARRAAAAVIDRGETQVHAAPTLCSRIAAALSADETMRDVAVLPDPNLAVHQCRITAGGTRIVADLPLQLAAIENRWSVTHDG